MKHLSLYLESITALLTSLNTATPWDIFTFIILKPNKPQVVSRFYYSKLNFRKCIVTTFLKSRWFGWRQISTRRQVKIAFVHSCIKIKWGLVVLIKIHLCTVHSRQKQNTWFYSHLILFSWVLCRPCSRETSLKKLIPGLGAPSPLAQVRHLLPRTFTRVAGRAV